MTLIYEIPRTSFVADGSEDTFATAFTFELPTEVTVWFGQPSAEDCCSAPSYDNLKHLNIDYVMLPGDYLVEGGSIQFMPHALPASGQVVTLMRTTPPDQPEGFGDQAEFQPEQHEFTLDRVVRMIQELYHNPLGVVVLGEVAYEHRFYAPDEWGDTVPMDVHNFARYVSYGPNLQGCVGSVEGAPSETIALSLKSQTGDELGTMIISDAGAVSFTTTNPAGFNRGPGSQLRVIPPDTGMAGAWGVAATFVGRVIAA